MPLLLAIWPAPILAADYVYATNNGAITITAYTGAGGDVTIPSTITGLPVTTIAPYAFYLSPITSVTIPATITNIGTAAFAHSSFLSTITLDPQNASFTVVDGVLFDQAETTIIAWPGARTGAYVIPDTVTTLRDQEFEGSQLVGLALPAGITNFGHTVFGYSYFLRNLDIAAGLTSIGDYAFTECRSLQSLALPGSVATIGAHAFEDCWSLANLVIPQGVTSFGDQAFFSCIGITSISIPETVTNMGGATFDSCYGLANLDIAEGVSSIGDLDFASCNNLPTVTLPRSVTYIGSMAFYSCSGLQKLYCKGNAPSTGWDPFSYAFSVTAYYLPGTSGWSSDLGGRPITLWRPAIQTQDGTLGVQNNEFGFTILWTSGMQTVVEATTSPSGATWSPLQTNIFAADSLYFSDPTWTNHLARIYRVRWQ